MQPPSSSQDAYVGLIKIRKINIYESPILTVKYKNTPVHIVLDSGATASLISLNKAKQLKYLYLLPLIELFKLMASPT